MPRWQCEIRSPWSEDLFHVLECFPNLARDDELTLGASAGF
jgi:hypothetical protein